MFSLRDLATIALILLASTYVLLSLLERLTHVRIARLGYLSLRHVEFPLQAGLKIEIGFVGIRFHRPTITRPTWISLVAKNTKLSVDLDNYKNDDKDEQTKVTTQQGPPKSKSATEVANRVKHFFSYGILSWVDLVVVDTTLYVKDCGIVQLGLVEFRVAHKLKSGARQLHSPQEFEKDLSAMLGAQKEQEKRGLEVHATFSNLRLQLEAQPMFEIIDTASLNIWSQFGGPLVFQDVGMSLKIGRLQLGLNDLLQFSQRFRILYGKRVAPFNNELKSEATTFGHASAGRDITAREVGNIFDVVTEIQIHTGFLKIWHQANDVTPAGKPVTMTAVSKDVVFNANRLDENSPDYRMLFDTETVAHQALISLVALTVHMNANGREETVLSIPLLTIASKTSSVAHICNQRSSMATDKGQADVTILNIVVTSPSSDIHELQIPILMALFRPRVKTHASNTLSSDQSRAVDKSELPRLDVSFGVHDPSIRIILETLSEGALPPMIIGRLSSIYVEAHAAHHQESYVLETSSRINTGRVYYHSPANEEFDVLQTDHANLKIACSVMPFEQVALDGLIDGLQVELSRPEIVECFSKITDSFHSPQILPAKLPVPLKHRESAPPLAKIPSWLETAKLQARRLSTLVSGADSEVAPDLRGIKVLMDDLLVDYAKQSALAIVNDDHALGGTFYKGHLSEALKLQDGSSGKTRLDRKVLMTMRQFRAYTVDSRTVLDKTYPMVRIPLAELAVSSSTDNAGKSLHLGFRVEDVILGFSIYKVYATLQALQVLRTAFVRHGKKAEDVATQGSIEIDRPLQNSADGLQVTVDGKVNLLRIKTRLPLDEIQMIDIDHLQITKRRVGDPIIHLRYARVYVDSPAYPGRWDRIVSLRDVRITRETHTEKVGEQVHSSRSLVIRTDGMRIRVPHQFVFYKMLEAIINSLKTSTQIIHRFITQTNEYVIAQHPKRAKEMPRIRIRSRIITVEAEDDPFESRLGLIFRVGLSEQHMRDAREMAFDRKVVKLREGARQTDLRRSSTRGTNTTRDYASSVRSGVNSLADVRNSEESSLPNGSHLTEEDDFPLERAKLQQHNSRAWILRMQHALGFRSRTMTEIRQRKWGKDDVSHGNGYIEDILEISSRPPLFSVTFGGVDIVLDKPSFALDDLPDFIHKIGRGMPKDTQYGLLIPVNLNWKMDEARIQVRDYPLPLLHVPPLHPSQRIKNHAWEFTADLVIGEEFPDFEAIRHIDVCVIPADTGREGSPAFNVEVQRTATSVKTFAAVSIDLNSALPTRVHWGTSMQPGISDVMRIMETLSKPQQDPSPKLGFWDKIALVMHTSVKLAWKHDGDMHITLKGSRDPYIVMGAGAGLTKVFRGNVRWEIGVCPDSRKLMEVMCDEYMLAIADFSRRAGSLDEPRSPREQDKSRNSLHHYHLSRKEISFQKILMKLTGDVRWTAGLAFERHCEEDECDKCGGQQECRLWDFAPHWHVKLKIPEYSILAGGQLRDAFKGYRSHYIHGQISVTSRQKNDQDNSYNTIHLTPRCFAHFFDWIHSFSGNLSLPIRAGPLFPSAEGPKQKFGQHLMTLKYNLQLEPLYLSHVYKSTNAADPSKIDMTGVKAKIDAFTLDLHQRKEERVVTNKVLETERTSQHMAIYRGQVDLKVTDLRALTAVFEVDHTEEHQGETTTRDPLDPSEIPRAEYAAKLGEFDVAAEDMLWIDMDDFTELGTILPQKSPVCRIIPLAYSPRFFYDRDTTQREGHNDETALSNVIIPGQRFGFEKTHYCSMIRDNKDVTSADLSGDAQAKLWEDRQNFIRDEIQLNESRMDEIKALLRETPNSVALNEEHKTVGDHYQMLINKQQFVKNLTSNDGRVYAAEGESVKDSEDNTGEQDLKTTEEHLQSIREEMKTFNNRFVVHDIQMKWNNTLRNILIRYIQQVNQRRGFSYYMSQKAVRFLSDLVDAQLKAKTKQAEHESSAEILNNGNIDDGVSLGTQQLDPEIEKLIKQLLDDRQDHFFVADETAETGTSESASQPVQFARKPDMVDELHDDYEAVNNYILRLIAPQIQLQSEKTPESAVVLTAQSMQMKILAVKDNTIAGDDVSALVQRKFSVQMTSAQFFYAQQKGFHGAIANLLTQNSYGADGDSYWPPWVPIESVYDFERSPRAFDRIVDRTSALCVYTKNNQLRIKKNENTIRKSQINGSNAEDRTDSILVDFPKFVLSANSEQYYAMFTIAVDLLMYSEPLQKERNEQIEKILLAADFSDLSGAPEMVSTLQKRIRQMDDFKTQFKMHAQHNDPQSKRDELRVEKELQHCEDELFFLMKSVATAQEKREDRDSEVIPAMRWQLQADEILWHVMEGNKAFIDFGLSKASFSRTDNSDSSNFNTVEIEMMQGINLSPDPVFAQLFAPYFGNDRTVVDARRSKMVRIYWYMLEAIGGIAVCDHFEVNLFPLRLQMEHDVAKKIFAYMFPDKQEQKQINSDSESVRDDSSSSSDDDGDGDTASIRRPNSDGKKKLSKMSFERLKHSASISNLSHKLSSSRLQQDSNSMYSDESASKSSSRRLSRTSSNASLQRIATGATNRTAGTTATKKKAKGGSSDDLTAMMNRANQNMSLVYVKFPSVILALSYKGAKAKNFVDVTDFVFKLPTIEYRNKTWSYLDLAEHLKREVIKAVLAHTGSLLRDKMTHYRKSKSRQTILAKQLTSYRTFVPADERDQKISEAEESTNSRHSMQHDRIRSEFVLQNRTSTAETSSLHEDKHGLFNNAIGRHIQHLSHLARHKDGLVEDNPESTMKKTRMLLGKFIDKAK